MRSLSREEAVAAATQLVDEVIQEAEAEARRRRKESAQSEPRKSLEGGDLAERSLQALMKQGSRLQTRAKGFVTRILTQLRICK